MLTRSPWGGQPGRQPPWLQARLPLVGLLCDLGRVLLPLCALSMDPHRAHELVSASLGLRTKPPDTWVLQVPYPAWWLVTLIQCTCQPQRTPCRVPGLTHKVPRSLHLRGRHGSVWWREGSCLGCVVCAVMWTCKGPASRRDPQPQFRDLDRLPYQLGPGM